MPPECPRCEKFLSVEECKSGFVVCAKCRKELDDSIPLDLAALCKQLAEALGKADAFFDWHQLDKNAEGMPLLTAVDRMNWKSIRAALDAAREAGVL